MKQLFTLAAALVVATVTVSAQRAFQLPLWQDNTDPDAADARAYVYLAEKPNGQAILLCPGGGYGGLAIQNEGHGFARWFNQNGISAVVLQYRLPKQRHTVPLADAEQAMRLIRSHAKAWGIRPDQVGVMGGSAGGHLASTLATHYSSAETRPDFQILLYPVITMDKSFTHMGTHDNLIGSDANAEMEARYSNEKRVTKDTPRAFLVCSATDNIVPIKNTLVYAQALGDNNVPFSLHMYPYGYHGFGSHREFKDADIWWAELLRWLQRDGK